jgi:PAS domain S-box-containing protein
LATLVAAMRISGRTCTQLFEGAEAIGIRRDELLAPLGLDAHVLAASHNEMEWSTFAAVFEVLSARVGGDHERLREVGRAIVRVPSYAFFQRIARTLVSPRSLYELGRRWVQPASFPHVHLEQHYPSEGRMVVRAQIPEPYIGCAPLFWVFEGHLTEVPSVLGLPRATVVESTVTPRTYDGIFDVPLSSSLVGRARRRLRSALRSGERLEAFEQQRRELALGLDSVRRSTAELQTLFDQLPDLVIIHRAGAILWANRALPRLLGYPRSDDLVGRQLLDIVHPSSREAVQGSMGKPASYLADGEPPAVVEVRLLTRDAETVVIEVSPTQEVAFGGQPARLVVGRDITERTRLRQQLLIADRMASIGMLAAGVAHEVNNPLAYVLNNIEMARNDLATLGEPTRSSRAALGVALEGVDRIRTIVRDLLELAKVDAAAVGPVDVRAIVESTVALAAQTISERAHLETSYADVPLVRGTPARLGQIVLNLITNALEAMPAETRNDNRLRVAVRTSGSRVVVEVSDNGLGIAPEHAQQVFDPFFTTKADGSGTGLGLAISQRLVAELGGELGFETAPELGTTFSLTLVPDEPS